MPRRESKLTYPGWFDAVDDACLVNTLREAYRAADAALDGGIDPKAKRDPCAKAFRVGNDILALIESGQITGAVACAKAAVAVRKYNTAAECVHPTATR